LYYYDTILIDYTIWYISPVNNNYHTDRCVTVMNGVEPGEAAGRGGDGGVGTQREAASTG
jgi:hypothetical protein